MSNDVCKGCGAELKLRPGPCPLCGAEALSPWAAPAEPEGPEGVDDYQSELRRLRHELEDLRTEREAV